MLEDSEILAYVSSSFKLENHNRASSTFSSTYGNLHWLCPTSPFVLPILVTSLTFQLEEVHENIIKPTISVD
jgi:hypothetical protein